MRRAALALLFVAAAPARADDAPPPVFLHGVDIIAPAGIAIDEARIVLELVPEATQKQSALVDRKLAVSDRGTSLSIDARATSRRAVDAPTPSYRSPSFLVDSDARVVVELAATATAAKTKEKADGPPAPGTLRDVVDAHIAKKSYSRGYDAASVVASRREGDCTEHAILLAAVARASGLPARVMHGVVLLEKGGRVGAYGHAWTEIWTGDSWLVTDATNIARDMKVVYLPLSVLSAEGPGFMVKVITSLGPHDIVRIRLERAP